ncbi:MAG TPA: hypothetical protein VE032_00115 [Actinomycetota bacterium]|nr:hypothetical protein [Actinomycetota bacterium]
MGHRLVQMQYGEMVDTDGVYRTEAGLVFKIRRDPEGHLSVQQLRDGGWVDAPVGLAGLRVVRTTRQLTDRQIEALGT